MFEEKPIVVLDKSLHNLYVRRDKIKRMLDTVDKNIIDVKNNIAKLNTNKAKDILKISDHAVARFKERVMDIPKQKILKLLGSEDLFNRHKEFGPGKYRLSKDYPNTIVVIEGYTIITCYLQFDSDERLEVIREWLYQWIEEKTEKVLDEDKNYPITLKKFKRNYYK